MARIIPILFLCLPLFLLTSCGTEPIDPAGFTGRTGGCGSFFVYRFNTEFTEAVVVSVDRSQLPVVDSTEMTLELTLPAEHVEVRIDRFDKRAENYYCNDVRTDGDPEVEERWNALSGSIRIVIGNGDANAVDEFYQVIVRLENVVFENENGEQVTVDAVDIDTTNVGWFPG